MNRLEVWLKDYFLGMGSMEIFFVIYLVVYDFWVVLKILELMGNLGFLDLEGVVSMILVNLVLEIYGKVIVRISMVFLSDGGWFNIYEVGVGICFEFVGY